MSCSQSPKKQSSYRHSKNGSVASARFNLQDTLRGKGEKKKLENFLTNERTKTSCYNTIVDCHHSFY